MRDCVPSPTYTHSRPNMHMYLIPTHTDVHLCMHTYEPDPSLCIAPGAGPPSVPPSWTEPHLPRVLSGKSATHHLISLPLTCPLWLRDDDRVELFSCQMLWLSPRWTVPQTWEWFLSPQCMGDNESPGCFFKCFLHLPLILMLLACWPRFPAASLSVIPIISLVII